MDQHDINSELLELIGKTVAEEVIKKQWKSMDDLEQSVAELKEHVEEVLKEQSVFLDQDTLDGLVMYFAGISLFRNAMEKFEKIDKLERIENKTCSARLIDPRFVRFN